VLSADTRLLVFSPHPDDATLGAGGLIQHVLQVGGAVEVVYMTSGDGYPEGIRAKDHILQPTAQDFRAYGVLRQDEALHALATLGVQKREVIFLGFPDRGLCAILRHYWADKPPYYMSPYTLEDRPPLGDVLLPHTEYDGGDLKREVTSVLGNFRPTVVVVTHPRDPHPDHCATYSVVRGAVQALEERDPTFHPLFLTFLIPFGQWPTSPGTDGGASLFPPVGFSETDGIRISFPLSPVEVTTKRQALLQHHSQMAVMAPYLLSFVRANELFSGKIVSQTTDDPCRRVVDSKRLTGPLQYSHTPHTFVPHRVRQAGGFF